MIEHKDMYNEYTELVSNKELYDLITRYNDLGHREKNRLGTLLYSLTMKIFTHKFGRYYGKSNFDLDMKLDMVQGGVALVLNQIATGKYNPIYPNALAFCWRSIVNGMNQAYRKYVPLKMEEIYENMDRLDDYDCELFDIMDAEEYDIEADLAMQARVDEAEKIYKGMDSKSKKDLKIRIIKK